MSRLDDLTRVARELDELDRRRALLLDQRDALLCELMQDDEAPGATTLARVVALTTTAIYKIVQRDSNRAVSPARKGITAHEPITRTSRPSEASAS